MYTPHKDLGTLPDTLCTKNPTDIGKINGSEHITFQIETTKPLSKLPQYPLKPEAKERLKPVVKNLTSKSLHSPSTSPCNTPVLPVKTPDGWGYWFFQDLSIINKIVSPHFLAAPNPNTILLSIPPQATCFTIVDICSAFFNVPLDQESQYFLPSLGKENSIPGQSWPWSSPKPLLLFLGAPSRL